METTITTNEDKEKWRAMAQNLTKAQLGEVPAEEKNKEPIDNDKNSSYITESGSSDGAIDNLLNETFKGDVKKLAEAYINSQKGVVKLAQEHKKLKELESRINEVGEKDPLFLEIIDAVSKGEPIRNRLEKIEPSGKQNAPVKVDKPNTLTEKDLIDLGLIDESQLRSMSSMEKDYVIMKAKIMADAKAAAEEAKAEVLRSTQEFRKKEQDELEKLRLQKLTDERYEKSLEVVVTKYNVDFAGEHADLLDDIHKEMVAFRDPNDPRTIHPKAFELAFQNVAERKNIQLEKSKFSRPQDIKTSGQPQIGRKAETKTLTLEEQLLARQVAKFNDRQQKTQSLYKF